MSEVLPLEGRSSHCSSGTGGSVLLSFRASGGSGGRVFLEPGLQVFARRAGPVFAFVAFLVLQRERGHRLRWRKVS